MSKLNDFLQVLTELNIPQKQFDEILVQNPGIINGDYDEFIININLLYKANVPKDVIGNLICQNANFLFYDSLKLNQTIKQLNKEKKLAELLQDNPDIF